MDHRELFHNGTKDFKNNFRIKYYLNNVNKKIEVDKSTLKIFNDIPIINEKTREKKSALLRHYFDRPVLSIKSFDNNYCIYDKYFEDLNNYIKEYQKKNYKEHDIKFVFMFGDNTSPKKIPCFVKAKCLNSNDYSVLLKLNTSRHIGMLPSIKTYDIPFHCKINKVIWRGSGTGMSNLQRFELVKKFQNTTNPMIDIKFTNFPQNIPKNYSANDFKIAQHVDIKTLLQYKFLISIEGNDVSTNLKWILLSNSVVLQPIPKKCSWFMEDMLIPFKHFIPLKDDFSDLEDKLQWCMKNLDKCQQIATNATVYMENFLDEENEKYITTEVIKKYVNNVIIN
jgi:hypothetical protein